MLLGIAGLVLLALGLFSGVVLVAAPLGLAAWTPGPVLWVLFPGFSLVGYALFVIGSRGHALRRWSLGVSGLLVLLALTSAAGLVLQAAGVLQPQGSLLSLWYVLVVAGLIGLVGLAALERAPAAAPERA